jgi:hypothetical protein
MTARCAPTSTHPATPASAHPPTQQRPPTFLREDDLVDDNVAAVNLKLGKFLRKQGQGRAGEGKKRRGHTIGTIQQPARWHPHPATPCCAR